jgi:hypothetical protein
MTESTIILPSIFTQKRLSEIHAKTKEINSISERIGLVKNKREFIEATLPRIECRNNWATEYKECEKLPLEQLSLDEALRSLWADVVKGLENG